MPPREVVLSNQVALCQDELEGLRPSTKRWVSIARAVHTANEPTAIDAGRAMKMGIGCAHRLVELEAVEELAVVLLEPVPCVEDDKRTFQNLALLVVAVHQDLPPLHLVLVGECEAVTGEVDEHEALGELVEVELSQRQQSRSEEGCLH